MVKANKNIGSQRDCQVKAIVVSHLQQLGYGLITILDSEGVNSTYKPNEFWVYKAMQVFL